jgi:hypothetical protein
MSPRDEDYDLIALEARCRFWWRLAIGAFVFCIVLFLSGIYVVGNATTKIETKFETEKRTWMAHGREDRTRECWRKQFADSNSKKVGFKQSFTIST